MKNIFKLSLAIFGLLLAIPAGLSAKPQPPQAHPAYLHALSDLRDARAHLQRPDGGALRDQEKKAIHDIDDAINEIKKASIDDGKDINDHVAVDSHLAWPGRLHRAIELLDKAHQDVGREEDNAFAQGLQQRAIMHIDRAHHHVEEAIQMLQ
jgi:hypothetical protein